MFTKLEMIRNWQNLPEIMRGIDAKEIIVLRQCRAQEGGNAMLLQRYTSAEGVQVVTARGLFRTCFICGQGWWAKMMIGGQRERTFLVLLVPYGRI